MAEDTPFFNDIKRVLYEKMDDLIKEASEAALKNENLKSSKLAFNRKIQTRMPALIQEAILHGVQETLDRAKNNDDTYKAVLNYFKNLSESKKGVLNLKINRASVQSTLESGHEVLESLDDISKVLRNGDQVEVEALEKLATQLGRVSNATQYQLSLWDDVMKACEHFNYDFKNTFLKNLKNTKQPGIKALAQVISKHGFERGNAAKALFNTTGTFERAFKALALHSEQFLGLLKGLYIRIIRTSVDDIIELGLKGLFTVA